MLLKCTKCLALGFNNEYYGQIFFFFQGAQARWEDKVQPKNMVRAQRRMGNYEGNEWKAKKTSSNLTERGSDA